MSAASRQPPRCPASCISEAGTPPPTGQGPKHPSCPHPTPLYAAACTASSALAVTSARCRRHARTIASSRVASTVRRRAAGVVLAETLCPCLYPIRQRLQVACALLGQLRQRTWWHVIATSASELSVMGALLADLPSDILSRPRSSKSPLPPPALRRPHHGGAWPCGSDAQ
jgi:hypothetical protein